MARSSWRVVFLVAVLLSLSWALPRAASARSYAAGAGPYSVAAGDVNGDGTLDLVVANSLANSISVLLGNGDGTFQAARTFDAGLGSGPIWVVIADVNGDRKPDILLANQSRNSVGVLLGNGDGTFQPVMNFATGGNFAESIVIRDFNGDGKMDLAFCNDDAPDAKVTVMLGNGDGSLQPAQRFSVGAAESESLAAGDFNGDGKIDLVVANAGTNNISVLLGNGDGTFQAARTFPVGNRLEFVAVGDFNGDGKLDVAVASYNTNTVGVLLGNGEGTFATLSSTAATPALSPGGGTFTASVSVTITDSTPGAAIYHTTDGSTPTTSSPPYTGPISVTHTTTLRAIATAPDFTTSAVASATYTRATATPMLSPAGGTFTSPQDV